MPNCKYCKVELEFDDTVDEYVDNEEVTLYEVGHCPNCRRNYKWQDYYEFKYYTNLEEDVE